MQCSMFVCLASVLETVIGNVILQPSLMISAETLSSIFWQHWAILQLMNPYENNRKNQITNCSSSVQVSSGHKIKSWIFINSICQNYFELLSHVMLWLRDECHHEPVNHETLTPVISDQHQHWSTVTVNKKIFEKPYSAPTTLDIIHWIYLELILKADPQEYVNHSVDNIQILFQNQTRTTSSIISRTWAVWRRTRVLSSTILWWIRTLAESTLELWTSSTNSHQTWSEQ